MTRPSTKWLITRGKLSDNVALLTGVLPRRCGGLPQHGSGSQHLPRRWGFLRALRACGYRWLPSGASEIAPARSSCWKVGHATMSGAHKIKQS